MPRTGVRSGAEIGLLSPRLSVSQGASLGDFLLAPACPIEKVPSGSETEGRERKFSPKPGIEPKTLGPKHSMLSTRLSLYPKEPG